MRKGGRGHPLRALGTGAARPALPGREWAAVSCYADPVVAHFMGAGVLDTAVWQWAPVPANLARAVLDSGALRHIRRVVELGAAHAGRCAAARPPRRSAPLDRAVTRGALPHDAALGAQLPEHACWVAHACRPRSLT
mgnify:CR=1 FL=1